MPDFEDPTVQEAFQTVADAIQEITRALEILRSMIDLTMERVRLLEGVADDLS